MQPVPTPVFYRLETDGARRPVPLEDAWAGPAATPCWLIGGGPSLAELPIDAIAASPAPKFAVNLAGHGLLRPNLWTSYDPTARFHRSIYLDPSITKFVHRGRAMDLVPETTFKVCEAPSTYFFDRDPRRGFHDWLQPGDAVVPEGARLDDSQPEPAIVDWQDSLVQAIAIAWRLGFRTLYLAGCEMFVPPSSEHLELAASVTVEHHPRELLRDFFDRCRAQGVDTAEFERRPPIGPYHFDEVKPLAAAIQTDFHYFRVAQYLRLSRRAMALAGLRIVSVTPCSRLNDYFDYLPAVDAIVAIHRLVGDPARESTRGRYAGQRPRQPSDLAPMRDFAPHHWRRCSAPAAVSPRPAAVQEQQQQQRTSRERLRQALDNLPEIEVPLADQ